MKKWKIFVFIIWIALLSIPFMIGFLQSDKVSVFGGFSLNPIDGNSYIAKMQQGLHGNWYFQLPYSAEYNGNAILFLFYIFIGKINNIFSLNLIFVFHIFRIIFSVCLFFTLSHFVDLFFDRNDIFWKTSFLTLLFGGGLGWLYIFSGNLPVDFWVAEAFPFLSSYSNPHFTLTLVLMVWGFIYAFTEINKRKDKIFIFFIGLLLSIISPFSVLITGFLFIIPLFSSGRLSINNKVKKLLLFAFGSAPMSIYQFFVVKNDPVLAIWNKQNITLSPSIANLLFSFSPFIFGFVMIFYIRNLVKEKNVHFRIIGLLGWFAFATLMMLLPIGLQRRFLVGYYLPVVVLFFFGLNIFISKKLKLTKFKKQLAILFFILSLPSTLLVYSGALKAIIDKNESLYVPASLYTSGEWMIKNIKPGSVFLSSPESGSIIPSIFYIKVVCCHPFETINYENSKKQVDEFWNDGMNLDNQKMYLKNLNVEFVYYGFYEKKYSKPAILNELPIVYMSPEVTIYEVIR